MKKIPVVLDTDLGSDIDDSWALAMLLRSPELDLKMVLTDSGDTTYRAKIAAKMLKAAGREDVAIGIGLPFEDKQRFVLDWVEGFELGDYAGPVHEDGVQALIDLVMASEETITLIGISSVPNIAEALQREPRIAEKIRFVGMHGSLYKGYQGKATPEAEANVANHNADCQAVFAALPDISITPLDTCGVVDLDGGLYQEILASKDSLLVSVIEQARAWSKNVTWYTPPDPDKGTSTLFDTVAVYMAYSEALLEMKTLGIRITDGGMTIPDPAGIQVRAALGWKDLGAFRRHLVDRLLGKVEKG